MADGTVTNQVADVANKAAGALGSQVEQGRQFADQVMQWLTDKGPEFAINLVIAAAIFVFGWIAIKIIGFALRKALLRGKAKGALLVNFVCSVVTKGLWAILAVVILGRLGVDVAPLIAGLGVTGFILGFAFQESLGNLASGMMIAINEPFKVGDFVEAAGHAGVILEVNMMATVMKTGDNKRIVIPNKSVWGGPIVNYNAMGTRRVDLEIGVDYDTDLERAIDVIKEALREVKGILPEPEPLVAIGALGDSEININVRPWCNNTDYWPVMSATTTAVLNALNRAKINIPYNQIVVHTVKD